MKFQDNLLTGDLALHYRDMHPVSLGCENYSWIYIIQFSNLFVLSVKFSVVNQMETQDFMNDLILCCFAKEKCIFLKNNYKVKSKAHSKDWRNGDYYGNICNPDFQGWIKKLHTLMSGN